MFTEEGPEHYAKAYKHNAPFARPGPYMTKLSPSDELVFRSWIKRDAVPFDPNEKVSDYDMRGYWKAVQEGKEPSWKGRGLGIHFPDTYKTPYDTTFSGESKYAKPNTPFIWRGNKLVDKRTGQVIFVADK